MSARLSDYDYDLPRELIAQRPLERRRRSRMMILHRAPAEDRASAVSRTKDVFSAGRPSRAQRYRVLPARRFSDNGAVEFLFLERLGPKRWKCMVTPGRKMRVGATAAIDDVRLQVEKITPDGKRIVVFDEDVDVYAGGSMPLPPYVIGLAMKRTRRVTRPFLPGRRAPWLRRRPVCILPPRS